MRAVTGKPIKLMGTGEKLDALEDFHPACIADRILGMGDIVSLVEKAAATIDHEKAMRTAERMRGRSRPQRPARAARADAEDGRPRRGHGHAARHRQDEEPIAAAISTTACSSARRHHPVDDPRERRTVELKATRKKRIAAGSGTRVEDINRMLKMHRGMADMMKAMGGAKRGPLAGFANALGMGGGMPSPEEMAKLAERMPGGLPGGMPGGIPGGLPGGLPGMPGAPKLPPTFPGLPGLGGPKGPLPGLGGFPDFGKKK
jgi:signal recognition particle subunit SRP54